MFQLAHPKLQPGDLALTLADSAFAHIQIIGPSPYPFDDREMAYVIGLNEAGTTTWSDWLPVDELRPANWVQELEWLDLVNASPYAAFFLQTETAV